MSFYVLGLSEVPIIESLNFLFSGDDVLTF